MKYLLISILILCLTGLTAQVTSARVTYSETLALNLGKKEMEPGMKALLSQLPKEHVNEAELLFSPTAATYAEKPYTGEEMKAESGSNSISFSFSEDDPDLYYFDLANQRTQQVRSVFDRKFQIEDAISPIDWSITEEVGFDDPTQLNTIKATGINSEGDTITAWYTPNVPVSTGPLDIMGLPGLIVRAEIGKMTYQVTSIEILGKAPVIPIPFTEGKTVSIKKFEKTKKAKEDAFRKQIEARGNVISIE